MFMDISQYRGLVEFLSRTCDALTLHKFKIHAKLNKYIMQQYLKTRGSRYKAAILTHAFIFLPRPRDNHTCICGNFILHVIMIICQHLSL